MIAQKFYKKHFTLLALSTTIDTIWINNQIVVSLLVVASSTYFPITSKGLTRWRTLNCSFSEYYLLEAFSLLFFISLPLGKKD